MNNILKRVIWIASSGVLFILFLTDCNYRSSADKNLVSDDTTMIAKGRASFHQHCAGCHNFRQAGIGPNLAGLTNEVSPHWIRRFIRDPKSMLNSDDARSRKLAATYKMIMPAFDMLSEEEVNGILSYIHSYKAANANPRVDTTKGIANPIPIPIALSQMEVGLELVTQVPSSSADAHHSRARITKLDVEPNSGDVFIVDNRGKLYRLKNNIPVVYMDMAKLKPRFIHEPRVATGFGSFAFHPDFDKNGLLYTTHSESTGSGEADFGYADSIKVALQWVVTEWKATDPAAAVFTGTGRELLRVNMVTAMHGVQEIAFNAVAKPGEKDFGLLYICIGDGASVEEGYPYLAVGPGKVWGSVLRIDPLGSNSVNGQYGIPPGNPFADAKDKDTLAEIYAYGFRNPHRVTWGQSGDMLVTNIGQAHIESINLVLPGQDFGWPYREGNFALDPYGDLTKIFPLPLNDSVFNFSYPVIAYDHDEGVAISGGYEYAGKNIPVLRGKFLFGDIAAGRLFYAEMPGIKAGSHATIKEWSISFKGKPTTLVELCGNDRVDLHFGRDASGELYLLTKADGKVYKLVSAVIK